MRLMRKKENSLKGSKKLKKGMKKYKKSWQRWEMSCRVIKTKN